MGDTGQPKLYRALYTYNAENNDELCFVKGDVITATQIIDGGWWEGTLEGKTGWFPSNYVKELKGDCRAGAKSPVSKELMVNRRDSMAQYHMVVVESICESERSYVNELNTFLQVYIRPLQTSGILSNAELLHLVGNVEDILSFQQAFLSSIEEVAKLPTPQQRVGGLFIKNALRIKSLYESYSGNHPKAVLVLASKREELSKFMEAKGASSPGIMQLTTSLSMFFRRLDKYPALLKELERHIEESHVDRGDTQRAIVIYRDLQNSCQDLRKKKEMENEILSSPIKNWEGEDISAMGDVIMMSHVQVHSEENKDRIFLLFPGFLVMLSVSPRLSGYIYEGKLALGTVTVKKLEDTENCTNAFELTGSMIERIVTQCSTSQEQADWVDNIQKQTSTCAPTNKMVPLQISSSHSNISTMNTVKRARLTQQPVFKAHKTWSLSCLRPCPPLRPSFFMRDDPQRSPRLGRKAATLGRKKTVDDSKTLEEDALILKVIEAYCTSAKRHTVNSSILDCPHMLVAEDEKIINEEIKGNEIIVEEKSLVDTVYSITDQLKDLKTNQENMQKEIDEEKRARKRLEAMLRKSLRSLVDVTSWDESGQVQ